MNKVRYIPHPDDEMQLDLKYDGAFNEITIYINDEGSEPFITQVNDRMTIQDPYAVLYGEFVRKPE